MRLIMADPNDEAAPSGKGSLTLSEVYSALGVRADEHISICNKNNGKWFTQVHTASNGVDAAHTLTGDVYFGLNPNNLPVGTSGHRGGEKDVARLAGLPADLDVKDGACPDLQTARAIIDDVSDALATRPVVVISSGRGLQPIWAVTNVDTTQGRSLLRRFGR